MWAIPCHLPSSDSSLRGFRSTPGGLHRCVSTLVPSTLLLPSFFFLTRPEKKNHFPLSRRGLWAAWPLGGQPCLFSGTPPPPHTHSESCVTLLVRCIRLCRGFLLVIPLLCVGSIPVKLPASEPTDMNLSLFRRPTILTQLLQL
jgi:hypothetical protein